jgi:molybdopterin-guanine dinucleotide biosynthesis protein A
LKTIQPGELRTRDPDLISFFNINTPADLQKAEAMQESWTGLS